MIVGMERSDRPEKHLGISNKEKSELRMYARLFWFGQLGRWQ